MVAGDYEAWIKLTSREIVEAGQFNSNKAFAIFR